MMVVCVQQVTWGNGKFTEQFDHVIQIFSLQHQGDRCSRLHSRINLASALYHYKPGEQVCDIWLQQ